MMMYIPFPSLLLLVLVSGSLLWLAGCGESLVERTMREQLGVFQIVRIEDGRMTTLGCAVHYRVGDRLERVDFLPDEYGRCYLEAAK